MKKLVILLFVIAISLCGCTKEKETNTSINADEQKTITELGVSLSELKNDVTNFILDAYMPVEVENKEDYITKISKYLSDEEYQRLLADIGDYNKDIETEVKDLQVRYGLAENNSDNTDKIMCSFYLNKQASGVTVRNKIILVFTIQGEEIAGHTVYTGLTEKRS